jgi:hypothetical protein
VSTLPALVDLVAKVREIAAAAPDYVYVRPTGDTSGPCYNVHRDTGGNIIPGQGCIIGRALTALGWMPPPPQEQNDEAPEDRSGVTTLYWNTVYAAKADDMARLQWLATVQGKQDGGATWSRAVAYADTL